MPDRRPLQLLLVEDSTDDEQMLLYELRAAGYQVVHRRVETETAMRSALKEGKWNLIISDYFLPHFSGPDALDVVNELRLDIPFIIVSGSVGEEAAVAAMRNGARDYVLKHALRRLGPVIERELAEAQLRAERRKLKEQLLISDRMAAIGTIAAAAAHEINTPLAITLANLELLASEIARVAGECGLDQRLGQAFDQLRDAQEGAERLRQIVRDLKLFSRPMDERSATANVNRVLDSSVRMAWNEIRHRARLLKEYEDVPRVAGNEDRLGQLFLNLIANAAQAIPEGDSSRHEIRISSTVDAAGRVVVEIADTGVGIAPENLERIFEAFFTTKPPGKGTGLGLALCHQIASDMGGEIQVSSELGRGSLFRVILPAAVKSEDVVEVHPLRSSGRRGHVLVVDDEPAMGRALGRTLGSEHDVAVVTSGSDALQQVHAGKRFDVILCDLMMPQMTGMDLHAALTQLVPEQAKHIVFMTGGAFTASARHFLDHVPNPYIEKPFETQALLAIVSSHIK